MQNKLSCTVNLFIILIQVWIYHIIMYKRLVTPSMWEKPEDLGPEPDLIVCIILLGISQSRWLNYKLFFVQLPAAFSSNARSSKQLKTSTEIAGWDMYGYMHTRKYALMYAAWITRSHGFFSCSVKFINFLGLSFFLYILMYVSASKGAQAIPLP
jgi:hypothetical protein